PESGSGHGRRCRSLPLMPDVNAGQSVIGERNPDFRCSSPSTWNRVAGITQRRKARWEEGPAMNVSATSDTTSGAPWVGRSIPRVEAPPLLSGRGRFIDDIGVRPGTLHAAILRSPHAHATIVSIDVAAAKQARGVIAVLTGEDIKVLTASLVVGVKA